MNSPPFRLRFKGGHTELCGLTQQRRHGFLTGLLQATLGHLREPVVAEPQPGVSIPECSHQATFLCELRCITMPA
jgi:hypothetical protein